MKIIPTAVDDKEGRLKARRTIEEFEQSFRDFLGGNGDVDEINEQGLQEYFIDGAYIRRLLIPEDTAMVSKLWKKDRLWIIAVGDVTITSELGTERIKAPWEGPAPYGSKVALYTHAPTLWYAITGSKADNSEEVEEDVIAKDYSECTYKWDQLEDKK